MPPADQTGQTPNGVHESQAAGAPDVKTVGFLGQLVVGGYLVAAGIGIMLWLWHVFPSCEPAGLIATGIQPDTVLATGGELIRIDGEGFAPGINVRVGDLPATSPAAVLSANQLTIKTPPHSAGHVEVVLLATDAPAVVVPGGLQYQESRTNSAAASNTPPVQAAQPAFQLSRIDPASGTINGGDAVTIVGAGFDSHTKVRFGGVPARSVVVDGSTRFVTATTPMHQSASVDVFVATDQTSGFLNGAFTFSCPAVPDRTMILMVLLAGALGGLVHSLRSFYWYAGQRAVVWNWVPMYMLLPLAGAALGLVFFLLLRAGLYQPQGSATFLIVGVATLVGMFNAQATEKLKDIADALFKHAPKGNEDAGAPAAKPTITDVRPGSGPVAGGITVTITGTGFAAGSTVRFGNTPGTKVAFLDAKTLTVVAPPSPNPVTVEVGVTVPNTQEVVRGGAFTYKQPVGNVTGVLPKEGSAQGGETVTVQGAGFAAATVVSFGDVPATNVTVVDDASLKVTTPAHAAGSVDVRVDAGDNLVGVQPAGYVYKP